VPYSMHSLTTETYEETDPEFNAWDKSTGITITENQITDLQPYLTVEIDGDPGNELQTLSQDGNTVTLTQGGGTISVADNDNQPANELQQLSKVGNTVSLSQNGGNFTDEVDDADANPANEIQNLSNIKNGNLVDLNISNASGTTIDVTDTDADPVNELQTLSQNGNDVTLSMGGGVISVADDDNDAANELQTIEEQDYNVSLSQGGGSFMTGVKSYTQAEIDAMMPYNGLVVFNTSTNCINYYNLNNWFEACGTCTPMPTQALAGDDQAFYAETTEATLTANTPEQGTGLWTVTSGEGGSFADATFPETTFSGQPCIAYSLAWTISNSCGESTDPIAITFFATPTIAFAGNDTIVLGGELSVNLDANTPEMGEGLWTVLIGEGGILADATNPTSLFSGLPYVDYTLQWAIATACDTSYDEVMVVFKPWLCGMPLTDNRDNQTYETVQIGEQCWMAENLNIGLRVDGTNDQTDDDTTEKYCYNNSEDSCNTYGGLYQWDEMMQYVTTEGVQGICPGGWHLPTDAEWCILEQEVDPTITCSSTGYRGVDGGGKLKESGTTHWSSPNTGATNSSGFTALPGGNRNTSGSFVEWSTGGYWWSSSNSFFRFLSRDHAQVLRGNLNKSFGISVRCLKDN